MAFMNERLDDPRWVGARRITSPGSTGGAGEHLAFRAVHASDPSGGVDGECLFLSWYVKVDAALNPVSDYLIAGLYNPTLSPKKAMIFRIRPFAAAAPASALSAEYDYDVNWYTGTESGGTWTWSSSGAAGTPPAWIDPDPGGTTHGFTRIWADPATNRWAVQLFVPIGATAAGQAWDDVGANLALPFKFFYHAQVAMPGSTTSYHQWPTLPTVPATPATFPNPDTQWGDVSFGGAGDPACSAGVSLDIYDVGTDTVPPGSSLSNQILFRTGWWNPAPPTQPVNTFHAKPWNRSGSSIPIRGLAARFRLANWGSVPDWDDPSLQNQLWTDIRGGGAVENTGAAIPNNAQGDLSFTWQLQNIPGELPDYVPQSGTPSRRAHQCMLVELSAGSQATGSIPFVNDSVYRNMDFTATASEFEREAEVSVKTLGSLGGTHRDVYLYVETLNMPRATTPAEERARRAEVERLRRQKLDAISKELPDDGRTHVGGTPEWLVPTLEDLEAEQPMYRVHVWHDTGETVTEEDGTTLKVLKPQTSFGYALTHDGALYGWNHELTADDLEEIAPSFYRLKVPNEGVATVSTKIEAHEKPTPGGCLGALVELVWRVVRAIRKLLGL
jgi:hypothetical protein